MFQIVESFFRYHQRLTKPATALGRATAPERGASSPPSIEADLRRPRSRTVHLHTLAAPGVASTETAAASAQIIPHRDDIPPTYPAWPEPRLMQLRSTLDYLHLTKSRLGDRNVNYLKFVRFPRRHLGGIARNADDDCGRATATKCHAQAKLGVAPICQPPRPVPAHMQERERKWLRDMYSANIIRARAHFVVIVDCDRQEERWRHTNVRALSSRLRHR